jgi:hydroxyethylthiazole kinase-like uncharacterized protein yjeF
MQIEKFDKSWFGSLWRPEKEMGKFGGGQITIIGGSELFHGAPVLALKVASRVVDMVYFSAPKNDKKMVAKIKGSLSSFIWVARGDLEGYVEKSDVVLVGPGMMRNKKEKQGFSCDEVGEKTRRLGLKLLSKFGDKKWVVDGGSLQVLNISEIPRGSLVTPNKKEFKMLFGEEVIENLPLRLRQVEKLSKKHGVSILVKGMVDVISNGERVVLVEGGNAGLTKGGTGDVLAGLVAALMVKNESILAAGVASYLVKRAGERLYEDRGSMFNADDVAEEVSSVWGKLTK